MTCPACGARNADSAAWCSQCLRPLGDTVDPAGASVTPDASAPPRAAPRADEAPPTERAFRTVDGEVEWRCPDCDAWNVFLVPVCARCGHRFGGGDHDRTDRTRRVLWGVAGVVAAVVVVGIVLVVLALRGAPEATPDGTGVSGTRPAPGAVAPGGLASTATSCPPATCGDP